MGTQYNHLNEMVLLRTQNTLFKLMDKKKNHNFIFKKFAYLNIWLSEIAALYICNGLDIRYDKYILNRLIFPSTICAKSLQKTFFRSFQLSKTDKPTCSNAETS